MRHDRVNNRRAEWGVYILLRGENVEERDELTMECWLGEGYGGVMSTQRDVCERGGYGLMWCGGSVRIERIKRENGNTFKESLRGSLALLSSRS
jgi:hypothetical protein